MDIDFIDLPFFSDNNGVSQSTPYRVTPVHFLNLNRLVRMTTTNTWRVIRTRQLHRHFKTTITVPRCRIWFARFFPTIHGEKMGRLGAQTKPVIVKVVPGGNVIKQRLWLHIQIWNSCSSFAFNDLHGLCLGTRTSQLFNLVCNKPN